MWRGLTENFSLQTFFKSEELCGSCEARCYSLHGRVSLGNRGSSISEQELHDQFLVGLCVGLR